MPPSDPIPGLKALIDAAGLGGKRIVARHFAFMLGPALNAAGRLDTATRSLELLLGEDPDETAVIADELEGYNRTRQAMTTSGIERAKEDIDNSSLRNDKVLVLYLPDVHESVAGLIAGKIRGRYEKPAIVFTDASEGIKGSGRSIDAYDMYAELNRFGYLFSKFGGHRMAAGISMDADNLDELRRGLNDNCTLSDEDMTTRTLIDLELPFNYVTEGFLHEMNRLEPFGVGNPAPVFALRNLQVRRVEIRGKRGNLFLITVSLPDDVNSRYELKLFDNEGTFLDRLDEHYGQGTAGDVLEGNAGQVMMDVIYNPGINEYMGARSLEYVVRDYRFK